METNDRYRGEEIDVVIARLNECIIVLKIAVINCQNDQGPSGFSLFNSQNATFIQKYSTICNLRTTRSFKNKQNEGVLLLQSRGDNIAFFDIV